MAILKNLKVNFFSLPKCMAFRLGCWIVITIRNFGNNCISVQNSSRRECVTDALLQYLCL